MISTRKDELKMTQQELLDEINEAVTYLKDREHPVLADLTKGRNVLDMLAKSLNAYQSSTDPKFKNELMLSVVGIRALWQLDRFGKLCLPPCQSWIDSQKPDSRPLFERAMRHVMVTIPENLEKIGFWIEKKKESSDTHAIASKLGDAKAILEASIAQTSVATKAPLAVAEVATQQSATLPAYTLADAAKSSLYVKR